MAGTAAKQVTAADLESGRFYILLSPVGSSPSGDVVQFIRPSGFDEKGWFNRFSFIGDQVDRCANDVYDYARIDPNAARAEAYMRENGAGDLLGK
ncbi:MAG: hypothetical protein WC518_03470 [Patescibacteria group bacterium]